MVPPATPTGAGPNCRPSGTCAGENQRRRHDLIVRSVGEISLARVRSSIGAASIRGRDDVGETLLRVFRRH